MPNIKTNPVNCRKCRHFYITWEQHHPYGCKVMGFKGKGLPSITVYRSTGQHCMMFQSKEKKAN